MNSVITEITDKKGGVVRYDANCAFCTAWARRGERVLKGRRFAFRPLPMPAEEMKVVSARGEMIGGASALVHLARQPWWAWPLWAMSRVPGVMRLLNRGYRQIASRRYRSQRACQVTTHRTTSPSAMKGT